VAGDDLYRDAVAAIDRAESRGAAEIQRLAEGHRVYAEAQALFAQDRLSEAGPGLAAARESLARSGSPFEHRAALDLAIVDYVSGRSEDASTRLSELGAAARTARHAYIAARATWIQGLIAFGQLRLVDARARYEETLSAFEVMGDG
jgi:thioredoxin-like negative regulator of GroEL